MFIKEVRDRCNITKKALDYYESKGLISPKVLGNGYRDYSENDVATVKEISVLRQCGISIPDIKVILRSSNKSAALQKCKYLTDIRMEKLLTIRSCINHLTQEYDVEREFDYLQKQSETIFSIKEQLVLAFPGNYGLFLALHFGRFLNEPIDTEETSDRNMGAIIEIIIDAVFSVLFELKTAKRHNKKTSFWQSDNCASKQKIA